MTRRSFRKSQETVRETMRKFKRGKLKSGKTKRPVRSRPPPPPIKGCIDVVKDTYDTTGNPLTPVPQFAFELDGNRTAFNDGSGHAAFTDVEPGEHVVSEFVPDHWQQLSVSPSGGRVLVQPGDDCAVVEFKNKQIIDQTPPPPCPTCNPPCATCGGWQQSQTQVNNVVNAVSNNQTNIAQAGNGVQNANVANYANTVANNQVNAGSTNTTNPAPGDFWTSAASTPAIQNQSALDPLAMQPLSNRTAGVPMPQVPFFDWNAVFTMNIPVMKWSY